MKPTEEQIDLAKDVLRAAGIQAADFRPINRTVCSALTDKGCKNGFVTGPGCQRATNGRMYSPLPECVREEHCGERYESTGGAPSRH